MLHLWNHFNDLLSTNFELGPMWLVPVNQHLQYNEAISDHFISFLVMSLFSAKQFLIFCGTISFKFLKRLPRSFVGTSLAAICKSSFFHTY